MVLLFPIKVNLWKSLFVNFLRHKIPFAPNLSDNDHKIWSSTSMVRKEVEVATNFAHLEVLLNKLDIVWIFQWVIYNSLGGDYSWYTSLGYFALLTIPLGSFYCYISLFGVTRFFYSGIFFAHVLPFYLVLGEKEHCFAEFAEGKMWREIWFSCWGLED